jgi:hypothetical protein
MRFFELIVGIVDFENVSLNLIVVLVLHSVEHLNDVSHGCSSGDVVVKHAFH